MVERLDRNCIDMFQNNTGSETEDCNGFYETHLKLLSTEVLIGQL